MLRSIVRTATIVIPRYTAPARAGSSSSVSCLRVLTQSWRREAYLRLSSGRYMWVRPGTRLYSDHLTDVGIEELDCLLKEGRVQLFDVREPSELLETGKIPRSVNIPRMLACMTFKAFFLSFMKACMRSKACGYSRPASCRII